MCALMEQSPNSAALHVWNGAMAMGLSKDNVPARREFNSIIGPHLLLNTLITRLTTRLTSHKQLNVLYCNNGTSLDLLWILLG